MLNVTGSLVYDTPIMRSLVTVSPSLKPALRKVADFILRNPMRSATMNIDEIATATGASTAAVNRLAHAIELAGFTGLLAALVENLLALISPTDKVRHELQQRPNRAFALELQVRVIKGNMDATIAANADTTFSAMTTTLINANRVYTLGFGSCHHLAGLAACSFLPVCQQAQVISTEGGSEAAACRLAGIGQQDVLFVVSLPPYSDQVLALARYAQVRKASVLAITDSPASPLARFASQTLYAPSNHPVLGECHASAMGVIEALASAMRHQCEGKASQALRQRHEALQSLRAPVKAAASDR
jgi:DNA-binding MurR/RpiR family transcriptional regulator